ncbi:MAG: diacylglycerol kinase [Nitrospirae bacterium]|nr:diacylglycerol kinase [Nitrospirota bacterium]
MTRLIKATGYSLNGLLAAWRDEWAFRVEVVTFVLLAPLAVWLGRTGVERGLLIGSLFLVLIAELVNSGIEAAIDRIGSDHHLLSKKAKDVGSAVVLIALANAAAIWALVLGARYLFGA